MNTTNLQHHPLGSGHPYRIDPDQRYPVHPIAGEWVEIRVVAEPDVSSVDLEVDADGESTTIAMERADLAVLYRVDHLVDDGHLAAASGARPDIGNHVVFVARCIAPEGAFRYRVRAAGEVEPSSWYRSYGAQWLPEGGTLEITGQAPLDRIRVEWLMTDAGPVRARLRLALDTAEHVVGFGERHRLVW